MKNLEDLEVVAVDLEMRGYKARLGNTQFDFIYAKFGQFLSWILILFLLI